MNWRLSWMLSVGWLFVGVVAAIANVAPAPRPAAPANAPPLPGKEAEAAKEVRVEKLKIPVQIKHADLSGEGDGVQAKLVLPARLRDLPPPAGAPGKVGSLENPSRNSLIAAVALSLAAVSVVFVVRGKKLTAATKVAIVGMAVLLGAYSVAQANAPPPELRQRLQKELAAKQPKIVVEFSADVTEAILTLPAK